jgi:hypothetical protein
MGLWGCQPVQHPNTAQTEMKSFGLRLPLRQVRRSNRDIASEFSDFMFLTETGEKLPIFSRFEEPIVVAFATTPNTELAGELTKLLARIRKEAGIDIHLGATGGDANIYVHAIPASQVRKLARNAQCFAAPNARNAREFRRNWRAGRSTWRSVKQRKTASVFIPNDSAIQVQRDCLHEEIAQALGPLNDLFRVPNTVFNDDNIHRVLTPYDMLILRTVYAPELQSGMTRAQVVERLPKLLKRLHPSGDFGTPVAQSISPEWSMAMKNTYRPDVAHKTRVQSASQARNLAVAQKLGQHRFGQSVLAQARLGTDLHPVARVVLYRQAVQVYDNIYGTGNVYSGVVSREFAYILFRMGRTGEAEALIKTITDTAQTLQDAEMMFMVLHLRAAIAQTRGHPMRAKALVAQARGWGLYAFGNHQRVDKIEQELGASNAH